MSIEALRAAVLGGDWSSATLRALADAQDALAAAEATKRLLVVGRRVRVPRGEGRARAMVSSVNDDGTVDVVYEDDDAEGTVSEAQPLEAFEEEEASEEKESVEVARIQKDRGSTLFGLKDYSSAGAEYQRCLATLKALFPLSTGALVMVNSDGRLRIGTVTSREGRKMDVMYDDGDDDDDDVSVKRVLTVLPSTEDDRKLMLTTYLNLARCASHAGRDKDAVTCCTLAGGIADLDGRAEHLVTSKILRARAHLAMKHLKQALRDSNAATSLAPSDKQVLLLSRDVDRAKRQALKANKKLAKEVTEWVSSAKDKFAEQGGNEADCAQQ